MTQTPGTVLITGVAGFIGHAVAVRMMAMGWRVVGLDNLNDYYAVRLKEARLADLAAQPNADKFTFVKLDLVDGEALRNLVLQHRPNVIIHLAAQAGVRYGLTHTQPYLASNLIGHFNVLEAAKALRDAGAPLAHVLYASSSSVYGNREDDAEGFTEADDVMHPQSLYAATKVANEALSHAWANQFNIPTSGMRFFTLYGPWGRPDMSPLLFMDAMHKGEAITLFNEGNLWRDFTYIADVVEAVVRLVEVKPTGKVPHAVYNIGNQRPTKLLDYIAALEQATGLKANLKLAPRPASEVYRTAANTSKLHSAIGWAPHTVLVEGLRELNAWYLQHRALL